MSKAVETNLVGDLYSSFGDNTRTVY